MNLKPWHTVVSPREDIRENKSLNMAEFAVHLDHIRDGRAPDEYQKPEKFFDRTFLTQNLLTLSSEMVRRLSGETAGTSAVFNMATQFGGGKTHSLTLLYHLAKNGERANGFTGVKKILENSRVSSVPKAETAVFVGTEFDAISGRGGDDGTPLRKTPWGEIAFQLGGAEAFALVAEHEKQMIAPAGDVIRKFLPENRPCLILLDEVMAYISRFSRGSSQFYDFLHSLTEEARARKNVVLCVSLPQSIDSEMSSNAQSEFIRINKMVERLAKTIVMSEENEKSEIIRRRLFDWETDKIDANGRILLNRDAVNTCNQFGNWVWENKQLLGFEGDDARSAFMNSYPFHPTVLSVFERKWASLQSFQRTRGILQMLAIWLSKTYNESYQKTYRDALIGLGSAPLEDSMFRFAVFDQLGERNLETAVISDICGQDYSHAERLDKEDIDEIKKSRLHRKVATSIFFESNGGQGAENKTATLAEIRMAVATPDSNIGNVETVLQSLTDSCFYLNVERGNKYKFSLSPNLNKILADRRANITSPQVEDKLLNEVRSLFTKNNNAERVFFPERSNDIADRAALTFVVLPPEKSISDQTTAMMETMTKECGSSARVFKSALIWCVPENATQMREEAKKSLAWEAIADEAGSLNLDESSRRQLNESLAKAKRDFSESVFRTYKNLIFLNADNDLQKIDLGLITSSAGNLLTIYLTYLRQNDIVTDAVSANVLVRKWNPAFKEWNTKSVRDVFFSSPQFPRLLNPESIKITIANAVSSGTLAYVAKGNDGKYDPFIFNQGISVSDIEISEDTFIITKETAEEYKRTLDALPTPPKLEDTTKTVETVQTDPTSISPQVETGGDKSTVDTDSPTTQNKINWEGEISFRDWTRFYKVITKLGTASQVKITVKLDADSANGFSQTQIDEIKFALKELGLSSDIKIE